MERGMLIGEFNDQYYFTYLKPYSKFMCLKKKYFHVVYFFS